MMAAPSPPLPLPPRLSPARARRVVGETRSVLFDCDGVLWEGERALPGAREVVGALQARGGPGAAIFVSNNSRRSRAELGDRFRGLGFSGVQDAQVYTSGRCAARYLRAQLLGGCQDSEVVKIGVGGKKLQDIEGSTDARHDANTGLQGSQKEDDSNEGLHREPCRSDTWDQDSQEGLHVASQEVQRPNLQDNVALELHEQPRTKRDQGAVCHIKEPPAHCQGVKDEVTLIHDDKDHVAQGDHSEGRMLQDPQGKDELLGKPQPDAPLVFVIGGAGLRHELLDAGLRVLGQEDTSTTVQAVLVGYDEEFSFQKLSRACTYLRDPDCLLVATDRDPWHLLTGGRCTPGTGSLVAAVETAAGRPAVVVGKPSLFMFEDILAQHDLDPSQTLMVGDRLEVDIQFGRNCGLTSILTLTGVSQLTNVQAYAQSDSPAHRRLVPDFYVESIADLLPGLEGCEGEL
ncbi:chronophin [Ambystoma mexicanum]|uniref:chronophin n=1 Tax=Ambystoma mexicanum TaxID=8296 RepID=UPI0037E7E8F0